MVKRAANEVFVGGTLAIAENAQPEPVEPLNPLPLEPAEPQNP